VAGHELVGLILRANVRELAIGSDLQVRKLCVKKLYRKMAWGDDEFRNRVTLWAEHGAGDKIFLKA
jgi:hypothetical protein